MIKDEELKQKSIMHNPLDFSGRVALVTGAAAEMGLATANEIANLVPISRARRHQEIASAVLWLCSPGASYVVGHDLTVHCGMTIAP